MKEDVQQWLIRMQCDVSMTKYSTHILCSMYTSFFQYVICKCLCMHSVFLYST